MRRLAIVVFALLAVLAAPARAYEVDLPLHAEMRFGESDTMCYFATVFPFAEVPGAVRYRAKLRYGSYTYDVSRSPGNYVDRIDYGDGQHWDADAGTHWFNGTTGGGGKGDQGCSHDDFYVRAWEILEAKAIMPDPVISGRVTDADGKPVYHAVVTVTGPSNRSLYTNADGRYTTGGTARGAYKIKVTDEYDDQVEYCEETSNSGCTTEVSRTLGPDAAVNFVRRTAHIRGRIVAGTDGVHPDDSQPAADVPVHITGKNVDKTVTTNQDGRYDAPLKAGDFTVTFPDYACVRDSNPCDHARTVHLATNAEETVNGVARTPALQVTVEAPDVTLEQTKQGWMQQIVFGTIKVRNNGDIAATNVRLDDTLKISAKEAEVPIVPVSQFGHVATPELGTIAPGEVATSSVPLKVEGDGTYVIDALAQYTTRDGRDLLAPGSGELKASGPFFTQSYERGPFVPSTQKPSFVQSGTTWSVQATLANRSYTHSVVVDLNKVHLRGNAFDGHAIELGTDPPALTAMDAAEASPILILGPRDVKEMKYLIRTTSSDAFTDSLTGKAGGGTRSSVLIDPGSNAGIWKKDHTEGALDDAKDVRTYGERAYQLSVDDSAPFYEPFSYQIAAVNITAGSFLGLLKYTAGSIKGFVYDLPKTISDLPTWYFNYLDQQTFLADAVLGDQATRDAYLGQVYNSIAALYPPTVAQNLGQYKAAIDKAVLEHYTRLEKEMYAGDWQSAIVELSSETTEGALNLWDLKNGIRDVLSERTLKAVALTQAPGVLDRFAPTLNAARKLHAKQAAEVLDKTRALLKNRLSYARAIKVLEKTIHNGYQLKNWEIRGLFGYTEKESEFLRAFARGRNALGKKLILTVRSRAAESAALLEAGKAVLKPEAIKVKCANFYDRLLGVAERHVAKVVLIDRDAMDADKVVRRMRKEGLKPGSPEWQAVLARRDARIEELKSHEDGFAKFLEKADRKGEITLTWNPLDNDLDPTKLKGEPATYPFRLKRDGNLRVAEFKVKGKWRVVTGDMDLLGITHADGSPLTDGERAKIYIELASSKVGLMHPETATWVHKGEFAFAKKIKEFTRSLPLQFAPDGIARRVEFVAEDLKNAFKDKANYRLLARGGYELRQP